MNVCQDVIRPAKQNQKKTPEQLDGVVDSFRCCTRRAEKVAEITSWLKSHPVSSVSRTSCELQVLDGTIVEKIEEAVEKVTHQHTSVLHGRQAQSSLLSQLTPPSVPPSTSS